MSADAFDCVTHLTYQGRDIYLLGTAHVSQRSVADVKRVIQELRPDTVCVELDATRHQGLVDPARWRNLDIFQVIRERRVSFLLSSLVLSSYQRRLGQKLGVRPGAEMLAAIEEADTIGARLVLADRDIRATLQRTWAALSVWDSVQLVGTLIGALFAKGEITAEQVEALKDRDTIGELIREFAEVMPRLQRPLIDERDRYLMSAIREAPGQRVLGVVGAGHVAGMVGYLEVPVDREELSRIPPPSALRQLSSWAVPVVLLLASSRAYAMNGAPALAELAVWWVCSTSLGTAAVSLIARPKPLTAIVTALASPLLSAVPKLGVGTLAAHIEARLRRPTVTDCEALSRVASRADLYANRFTRVLLVGFAAAVGGAVGACVGTACVAVLSL